MSVEKPANSVKSNKSKKSKQLTMSGAMDTFVTPKRLKIDELEVTGVSRSGRVRKKSSKLMDFESPDDLNDSKLKRQQKAQQAHAQQLLEKFEAQQQQIQMQQQHDNLLQSGKKKNANPPPVPTAAVYIKQEPKVKQESISDPDEMGSGSDSEMEDGMIDEERYSMESASEEEVDPLLIDEKETGFKRLEPPEPETPSQANSLYMLEKCKKKVIIKDGKIIGRMKAQRKDKGKTRFTAYMLWAKEVRQELLEQCPYMDFAAVSKRLGELWATVPNLEKYNWRRRAKRLAAKPVVQEGSKDDAAKTTSPGSRKKFINKIGNGKDIKSPTKKTGQGVTGVSPTSPVANRIGKDLVNDPVLGTGMYKVVGTQPADVAAHLKLLGESLTIIGERLKEHEGQIAVSGSLSVLLDSLLCALGPLMCLTQQIPELYSATPELYSEMLDNIAYIMPGL